MQAAALCNIEEFVWKKTGDGRLSRSFSDHPRRGAIGRCCVEHGLIASDTPANSNSAYVEPNSDVQKPQRVALIGISEKQCGQSLVVGSSGGASSSLLSELIPFMRRKTANAIIRKLIIVLINIP